ncbi:hypothetical protein K504DRAFT_446464 [Pleomassaria siparia CBS 279.74]|uniref:PHD-type domain-containing protein n=1 Tax=Pleomassaria siparia CBS 279.74 TaxID=1314801 RepID=A0A6G1KS00_9PLEO|nr:hypothetical protein K504DRAFT_446464 [Pleomassaria siparia CBS 279.74]
MCSPLPPAEARHDTMGSVQRAFLGKPVWLLIVPWVLLSTDWHLPSPSSTPKSLTFPDSTLRTPKTDVFPHSHFLDAWSTPRPNGQQTPAQTPSFAISTSIERPSTSYSQKVPTPEDPEFHVNHLISNNLSLPPVEPARRLSSSPGPLSVRQAEVTLRQNPSTRPRPVSMDTAQMQTPPPTRDDNSRRGYQQHTGNDFSTPATVISRTPVQVLTSEGLFNQTPYGFPSLQFSPDLVQFPSTGPMSAPPIPHSRLFWDPSNDGNHMDVDMSIVSDPFGSTPHQMQESLNWQAFHTPINHMQQQPNQQHMHQHQQMNPQAFHALHSMPSPGPNASFAMSNAGHGQDSRPASFISTSGVVDPSMLFSFSSPGPTPNTSFNIPTQQTNINYQGRLPYETQARDSLREREMAKRSKSQHSRTSTSSSTASFEGPRPCLQRSNTDSGFRKNRPSSSDSRSSGTATGFNIPRRSSPLKRGNGGSLLSIPEVRRPRTRLVVDETGRARTETVPAEDETDVRSDTRSEPQNDIRRQYPGLWNEDDSDDSELDEPVTLSRNTSYTMPQLRPSKHARAENNDPTRFHSVKMSKPFPGMFDKSSLETIRPTKKAVDNSHHRFSMMDFSTSFGDVKQIEVQHMPDSPGDAAGALKKMFEGRQKRIGMINESGRSSQNTLKAHNQRWAQASADLANTNTSPYNYDHFTNSFNGSPATDASLTTPSTDRSSLSGESTRCICSASDDGRPMVQCESCQKWLHMACVGINSQSLPPVYVCIFCTGNTPIARGGRVRGPMPAPLDSPLTHKSVFRRS